MIFSLLPASRRPAAVDHCSKAARRMLRFAAGPGKEASSMSIVHSSYANGAWFVDE
jgi:hypothetical protein